MTSASLSAFNNTLTDGIRDQLADDFARRIFDTIPEISECIEFEAEACDVPTKKRRFERAAQMIFARRRDLQLQTTAAVRRIFDERLDRLIDGAGRDTRLSLDNMTLLADERLDEEIAVNHCSRRLKEQCKFELWGLTQRIASITGMGHPADCHNPIFTQTFAQALMEAIGSLETDASVRLVVFKTFGPVLLEIVPAVYTAANAALQARGIEVESGNYYGRPILTAQRVSTPLPTSPEMALGAAQMNQELTSALRQILASSSSPLPARVETRNGPTVNAHLADTAQLPIARAEDMPEPAWHGALRDIEARTGVVSTDQAAASRTLHGARRSLQEKLTRDEQVISDIVTAAFDRLRVDARMPTQLRASVSRLELPVLELALRDRSLLTQVHHPVRKLLDLIAEFGLTLGLGDDDDSKVRSVENIIDGLVQIRDQEPNAFKLAFQQLDGLFYHHEEAALQTDSNLRAMERVEAAGFAGRQADREIAVRLQNLTLPVAISSFIQTAWRNALIHDFMYGGPMGKPWKLGLATLDDIVKSLRPATAEAERRRLVKMLPSFVEILLITEETNDDQDVITANFFVELDRAHGLALAGKWAEIGGEPFVPSIEALSASSSVASPSATLAALGLACGDWIETRDFAGTRRWRLNWITTILGTCVFKHYETKTTRNMSCNELRDRLVSGEVQRVRGLGLADEILNSAFETVSRKARRDEAMLAFRVPSAANRDQSNRDVSHQWGPAVQGSPAVQIAASGLDEHLASAA